MEEASCFPPSTALQHLAKRIGDTLFTVYPGYLWYVMPQADTLVIRLENVSSEYGYVVHPGKLDTDPMLKSVIMKGGEILERFKLDRAAAKEQQLLDLKRDVRGEAIEA